MSALSDVVGKTLPFDSLGQLRKRLAGSNAVFAQTDTVTPAEWKSFGIDGAVASTGFDYPIANYYMTDPISRASRTMAQCTEAFGQTSQRKTGTHG